MSDDALALVELDSIARGLKALDALVKKAPVRVLEANLVEPGRFLVLFSGGVAEVGESFEEATLVGGSCIVDKMLLPMAHPALVLGLKGAEDRRPADAMDTLGVIEGSRVASTLEAADRSLKEADVRLAGIRVAVGLGGRAFYIVFGPQHDVEASIEAGRAVLEQKAALHRVECIPRPHDEMVAWLLRRAPFAPGLAVAGGGS